MLKRLLWFVVGVLLAFNVVVAKAAGPVWFADGSAGCAMTSVPIAQGATQEEACAAAYNNFLGVFNNGCAVPTNSPVRSGCGVDGCNVGGGCWHHTMNSYQACADGSQPVNGECAAPTCSKAAGTKATNTYSAVKGQISSVGATVCDDHCSASVTKVTDPRFECGFGSTGVGLCYEVVDYDLTYSGASCQGSETSPKPKEDKPIEAHKPKCTATEGVLTSSSGTVACVPEGTPDTVKPVVQEKKKVETFPDGSTKTTTETTTIDPATGAKDVQSTVTATGGQSGTAGTTTSGVSTSGSGTGGGGSGDCDPTLNFCGGPGTGGLYDKKSKTVAGVLGEFKTGALATGFGQAASGFFNVSVPSGSCPVWVAEVPLLNVSLDVGQYFCTSTAINMMNLVGAVLLFVAAFVGFRWAIL